MFDLDGTILSRSQRIAPRVVDAIGRLQAAGVKTAVCSGRPRALIRGSVSEAGCMDFYVTSNGACIADAELRPLVRRAVSRDDALRLHALLKPLGAAWQLHMGEDTYAELGAVSYMAGRMAGAGRASILETLAGMRRSPLAQAKGWHSCLSAKRRIERAHDGIEKLDCSFPSSEAMMEAERLLARDGAWEYARMGSAQLEITAKGVTKGTGAETLARIAGVPIGEAVAFGDGGNDIPLIGHVGRFVAMGNAAPELKAQADEGCPDIGHDGVAVWIDAFLAGRSTD